MKEAENLFIDAVTRNIELEQEVKDLRRQIGGGPVRPESAWKAASQKFGYLPQRKVVDGVEVIAVPVVPPGLGISPVPEVPEVPKAPKAPKDHKLVKKVEKLTEEVRAYLKKLEQPATSQRQPAGFTPADLQRMIAGDAPAAAPAATAEGCPVGCLSEADVEERAKRLQAKIASLEAQVSPDLSALESAIKDANSKVEELASENAQLKRKEESLQKELELREENLKQCLAAARGAVVAAPAAAPVGAAVPLAAPLAVPLAGASEHDRLRTAGATIVNQLSSQRVPFELVQSGPLCGTISGGRSLYALPPQLRKLRAKLVSEAAVIKGGSPGFSIDVPSSDTALARAFWDELRFLSTAIVDVLAAKITENVETIVRSCYRVITPPPLVRSRPSILPETATWTQLVVASQQSLSRILDEGYQYAARLADSGRITPAQFQDFGPKMSLLVCSLVDPGACDWANRLAKGERGAGDVASAAGFYKKLGRGDLAIQWAASGRGGGTGVAARVV